MVMTFLLTDTFLSRYLAPLSWKGFFFGSQLVFRSMKYEAVPVVSVTVMDERNGHPKCVFCNVDMAQKHRC